MDSKPRSVAERGSKHTRGDLTRVAFLLPRSLSPQCACATVAQALIRSARSPVTVITDSAIGQP